MQTTEYTGLKPGYVPGVSYPLDRECYPPPPEIFISGLLSKEQLASRLQECADEEL